MGGGLKEVYLCCMGKGRLGLKVVGNIKRNRSGINFHRDKNCKHGATKISAVLGTPYFYRPKLKALETCKFV